jgi:hypothetical protein
MWEINMFVFGIAFFGMAGSHNGTIVFQCSQMFPRLDEGHAAECYYKISGHQYTKGY